MQEGHNQWKESSYATDENGQYYYFERWERLPDSPSDGPRLALRKSKGSKRDGVIVVVGDHFNYILARELTGNEKTYGQTSLVALVDAAVENEDLDTAKAYLSIEAGHGLRSKGWQLDCTIPPWKTGSSLWDVGQIRVEGTSIEDCHIHWSGESWDVMDSSFKTVEELKNFLKR